MRRSTALAAMILALAAAQPALACRMHRGANLEDVRHADMVVVGRITGYRIVRDEAFRRKMLSNPKLSPELRKLYEGPGSLMPDYARFEIEVETVLVGKAPRRLSVTCETR